jgi:hypothetical protein
MGCPVSTLADSRTEAIAEDSSVLLIGPVVQKRLPIWHYSCMRELIYLSERKLEQFMTDRWPLWRSRIRMEGEIRIPGIGAIKVGPSDTAQGKRNGPDLEEVISALEGSRRAARWFADEELQPGQWVYFEAPLSYMTIGHAVVFLDLGEPIAGYPTGGIIRLVLHGSSIHLAAGAHSRRVDSSHRHDPHSRSVLYHMMQELNRYIAAEERELKDDTIPMQSREEGLALSFDRIIEILDRDLDQRHTSAWMAGYARITTLPLRFLKEPRIIVATPLYVEYAAEPQNVE